MGKLLPVILAILGLGAGVGAGILLRPEPAVEGADTSVECLPPNDAGATVAAVGPEGAPARDFVKLNNQFIVPIVEDGQVSALVIMSISLEVDLGASDQVYSREPKLRDAFLQVLFDHANSGGFRGAFTQANNMDILRNALREVAWKVIGSAARDVLITDIVRQDA